MLKHYLVHALRTFWRFKLSTAVNIIGLSLGLVCFVASYVFIDSMRHSDAHFPNASRIFVITEELWTSPTDRMIPAFPQASPPVAKYLKADFPQLEVARALALPGMAAAGGDRRLTLAAAAVDPEFLKIFDFTFVAGEARDALSGVRKVILTEQTATRLFGRRDVAGESLLLQNRVALTVSGVIAEIPRPSHLGGSGGQYGSQLPFEMLLPMDLVTEMIKFGGLGPGFDPSAEAWGNDSFWTYVLLPADGSLTIEEFRASLHTFGDRHVPRDRIIVRSGAVPVAGVQLAFLEAMIGSKSAISMTTTLLLLDVLILLIACLNYANLSVAMATTRGKEIGMRRVLGAGRLHLVRQYLVEAALLGVAALAIVVAGTALAIPLLNNSLDLDLRFPSLVEPGIWLGVLLLVGCISLAGGAYPALVLSRVRPVEAVRAGAVRAGPRFVPTLLVGVQFAAASFLLVITLLMANQNSMLQRSGIRADQDPIVNLLNNPTQVGVDTNTLRAELLRSDTIKSVSGTSAPLWSSGGPHVNLRRTADNSSTAHMTLLNLISHDFFETLELPLLAGRKFERDRGDEFRFGADRTGNLPVLIDRSLARQLGWLNPADAVGKTIHQAPIRPDAPPPGPPVDVVGVVEDGYPRLIGPNTESNMYFLMPDAATFPVVRIDRNNVSGALAHIDAVWNRLSPNAPLQRQFADDLFNTAYQSATVFFRVLAGLSGFAFVIAMLGLFGMSIHVTSRRRREIGIRKTLGATAPRVVLMLLRDFSRPVVVANVIAWPLAFLAGQVYLELFVQRAPLSPVPFVVSLLITLAIAWGAVSMQAVRAAGVKPARVLRAD
jgi:putative ABC transport system permease protein